MVALELESNTELSVLQTTWGQQDMHRQKRKRRDSKNVSVISREGIPRLASRRMDPVVTQICQTFSVSK
jgi:hypothetical protein